MDTPTPTPTNTPTNTVTPSITPTFTPTPTETSCQTPPSITLTSVSGGTHVRITNNGTENLLVYNNSLTLLDIIGGSGSYNDLPFALFGGNIVVSPTIFGSCYFCYDTEFLTLTTCTF